MSRDVKHMAVILDGNGRWAEGQKKDIREWHFSGFQKFREMALHVMNHHPKIQELSGWAFAPSNMKRPLREVAGIFLLIYRQIWKFSDELMQNDARFQVIGDLTKVPKLARKKLEETIQLTKNNNKLRVNLNIMYDGREEVLGAMRKLAQEWVDISNMDDGELDTAITSRLHSGACEPVDLLFIPWSEKWIRIRDYYLWRIRNAHIHGIDTLLPDVTMGEMDFAISRAESSHLTNWARPAA